MRKDYKELIIDGLKNELDIYDDNVSNVVIHSFTKECFFISYDTIINNEKLSNKWHYTGNKALEIYNIIDSTQQ